MSKVIVTGGAGFIGSHTVRTLLNWGHEVWCVDVPARLPVPTPPTFLENIEYRLQHLLYGARMIKGSIENPLSLRRHLVAIQPDYIVHLAASPSASQEPEDALGGIVGGTVNLLEAARELPGLQKFVYVSSSMVYGDFARVPMPEEGLKEPKEVYGGMKLAAEILVKAFGRRYGVPYSVVRPSAVYGPTNNNRSILQIFVENAFQGQPVSVRNPDITWLDFSYVKDVARGLALVTLSPQASGQEFNITRGEGRSLGEVVEIFRELFPTLQVQVSSDAAADFRPNRGALDISKARRIVGYEPEYALEAGLKEYVEFVRANNPSIMGVSSPILAQIGAGLRSAG